MGVLFSVEGGRLLEVVIDLVDTFPVVNPKHTDQVFLAYVGLEVDGNKLVGIRWSRYDVAPEGTLIFYGYVSGERKKAYHLYRQWFIVTEYYGELVLKDLIDGVDVRVKVKNMRPLGEYPDENMIIRAEREILSKGLQPSDNDPVRALYGYWLITRIHETLSKSVTPKDTKRS
jgi:hypothetical protein